MTSAPSSVADRVRSWFATLATDPRRLVVVLCVLAAIPRLWLAVSDHSVYWPDEIYQSIEPAHRAAFGYGLFSWEFRDGARSWLLPGVLAVVLKPAALVTSSGLVLVTLLKVVMVAISILGVWATVRYAEVLGGWLAALLSGLMVASYPPLLVLSHRATPEMASAPMLVAVPLALALGRPRAAGVAAGLAVALRMQTAPLVLVFFVDLVVRGKRSDARQLAASATAVGIAAGLLDWVTWGKPFNSVIEYMTFTIRGGSSTFGVHPPSYFLEALWNSTGWMLPVVLLGCAMAVRLAPASVLGIVAFVVAHAVIPHKEFRFLSPAMPLLLATAAAGLVRLGEFAKAPPPLLAGLGFVAAIGSGAKAYGLRNGDMGHYLDTPYASESVWHFQEGASLLLHRAGQQPDVCGVLSLGLRAGFTGGYSYLHREVPLIFRHQACEDTKTANYIVAHRSRPIPAPYARVETSGDYALFRRPGGCSGWPKDFNFMLEGADDMGLYRAPLRQADVSELDIAAGTSAAAFVSGWSHGEQLECRETRWAVGKVAELHFPLEPTGSAYALSFSAQPYHRAAPQTVQVAINGYVLSTFDMPIGWLGFQAVVPARRLRPGTNALTFKFSNARRAEGTDQRELAALFDRIRLAPISSSIEIDVGTSAGRSYLTSGFSGDERVGDRTAAWSIGSTSRVTFSSGEADEPEMLRLNATAFRSAAPLSVSIRVNGVAAGTLTVPARWSQVSAMLPADAVRPGLNTLDFQYSKTARPMDADPASKDDRDLALMVDRIALEPLPFVQTIDFGTPAGRRHLLAGWSSDEVLQGRTTVWSDGPVSEIAFRAPPGQGCTLAFTAHAYEHTTPQKVELHVNSRPIGSLTPTPEWGTLSINVPREALRLGVNVLELRYARSARPNELGRDNPDDRLLALRLDRLDVTVP